MNSENKKSAVSQPKKNNDPVRERELQSVKSRLESAEQQLQETEALIKSLKIMQSALESN